MSFKPYSKLSVNASKKISLIFLMFVGTLRVSAQDNSQILTRKGNVIHANVETIRNNRIVYRRFGKHEMDVSKVLFFVDEAGKKTELNPVTAAKNYKKFAASVKPGAAFQAHTIERVGNSWRIDTSRIVSTKQLNSILAQSPDPVVKMNLKSAKLMRTLTKITKITSYPSTLAGGFASFKTFKTVADQMKAGPVSFNSYLNAGLSFLGTLSMPVTKAILNKIQKKKYDTAVSAYVSS
jgi:hypothetical protein